MSALPLDRTLRLAIFATFGIGVGLAALLFPFGGARATLSALVGAVVATGNLYALTRIFGVVLADAAADPPKKTGAGPALAAVGKVLSLFIGGWLTMRFHLVDPLPLVIGYLALPAGAALAGVLAEPGE